MNINVLDELSKKQIKAILRSITSHYLENSENIQRRFEKLLRKMKEHPEKRLQQIKRFNLKFIEAMKTKRAKSELSSSHEKQGSGQDSFEAPESTTKEKFGPITDENKRTISFDEESIKSMELVLNEYGMCIFGKLTGARSKERLDDSREKVLFMLEKIMKNKSKKLKDPLDLEKKPTKVVELNEEIAEARTFENSELFLRSLLTILFLHPKFLEKMFRFRVNKKKLKSLKAQKQGKFESDKIDSIVKASYFIKKFQKITFDSTFYKGKKGKLDAIEQIIRELPGRVKSAKSAKRVLKFLFGFIEGGFDLDEEVGNNL